MFNVSSSSFVILEQELLATAAAGFTNLTLFFWRVRKDRTILHYHYYHHHHYHYFPIYYMAWMDNCIFVRRKQKLLCFSCRSTYSRICTYTVLEKSMKTCKPLRLT